MGGYGQKHIQRHMNRNSVSEINVRIFFDDYEDEDNSNGKNTQWAGWWEEREEVLIMGTSDPVCAP